MEKIVWASLGVAILGVVSFLFRLRKKGGGGEKSPSIAHALRKTRALFKERIRQIFSEDPSQGLESIREALLAIDVGPQATEALLERLGGEGFGGSEEELFRRLSDVMEQSLERLESKLSVQERPYVILFVGVNGVGKTTTIAKVAHRFLREGETVLLAAADTFRAGAVSQLKIWGDRLGVPSVAGEEGADPASIAFQAIESAKAQGIDIVLIDSAGRLHTQIPLMDQLKKIRRVCAKAMEGAPHQVWLVLDATLGTNTVEQVERFHQGITVSGILLTKLDGSAKGGALLAVAERFSIPVYFLGVGENLESLIPFSAEGFTRSLLERGEDSL